MRPREGIAANAFCKEGDEMSRTAERVREDSRGTQERKACRCVAGWGRPRLCSVKEVRLESAMARDGAEGRA